MPRIFDTFGAERGDKVTRLEAFVDASFAFALTLLVISGDSIPTSVSALAEDLKQIPAYAASFFLIIQFWSSHAEWSRRFGLDDAVSNRLSLVLVFLLLIFVYPLNMAFGAFFDVASGGWLRAQFVAGPSGLLVLFQTFAAGFGTMALVMALLFWRALRLAESAGFSSVEIALATHRRTGWLLVVGFSVVSFFLATVIPPKDEFGLWLGTPGFIFFGLNVIQIVRWYRFKRLIDRLHGDRE